MAEDNTEQQRTIAATTVKEIQTAIFNWYDLHGRKTLPWQHNRTCYRVWLSEVMLQQTTVKTVIPYFERFTECFPTVKQLAEAHIDQVLHLWSGLGYYSRARNMHKAAQMVMNEFGGDFPEQINDLQRLPGVGRSTAGAIMALGRGTRAAILDGNVKRLLCRLYAVAGWSGRAAVSKQLWQLAELHTPATRLPDWTQAVMDMGATLCTRTRPACERCPVQPWCQAWARQAQNLYPQPRPRKETPLRQTRMLMCVNGDHEVLLQKRPARGIWGGLWSFPELSVESELHTALGEQLNIDITCHEVWPRFRHTFSHYELDIEPVRLTVEARDLALGSENESIWLPLSPCHAEPGIGAGKAIGLAAPVQKLLAQLCTTL